MRFSLKTPYTMATMTFWMVGSLFRTFWCAVNPKICETLWPGKKPNDPDIGYSSHFVEGRD